MKVLPTAIIIRRVNAPSEQDNSLQEEKVCRRRRNLNRKSTADKRNGRGGNWTHEVGGSGDTLMADKGKIRSEYVHVGKG